MSCIFCGGTPTTKEHVFPRWLNRYLSSQRQQLEQTRYGEGEFDITRPSVGLDFTVRKVCDSCNSGWMSSLESETIGILNPLISGLDLQLLSLKIQRQIALWGVKTAMVLDHTQVAPVLPSAQLARLRSHRVIPGNTRVWLGACDELYPLVTSYTIRIDLENRQDPGVLQPGGFYCPMKIGHLCLYVYFTPADVTIQYPPRYGATVARIWPRRGSSLPWPPPVRPGDGEEFEYFANIFWRELAVFTQGHARELGLRES
jgi:hypothetical protein